MTPLSRPPAVSARDLLTEYVRAYKDAYHLPYPVSWAKHSTILKRMLELYGSVCTRRLLKKHLRDQEEFVVRTGHSIETLPSQVPRYLQLLRDDEDKAVHGDKDFEKLQKLMDA